VESFEISKLIRRLAAIVMFYFNSVPRSRMFRWNGRAGVACGGCVN
jgi:hypothetical protein